MIGGLREASEIHDAGEDAHPREHILTHSLCCTRVISVFHSMEVYSLLRNGRNGLQRGGQIGLPATGE